MCGRLELPVVYLFLVFICMNAVPCPSLTDPENGIMTCSLGDDEIPSFEDVCKFTCNTYFIPTGSHTRICQNDESWSGTETICSRSE